MAHVRYSLIASFGLSLLAACSGGGTLSTSDISRDVANAIAACSSGITMSQSVSLQLRTDLTNILEGPTSVDLRAEIADSIRGLAFTPEVLSDAEGQASYQAYTACVTGQLDRYLPAET